MPDQKIGVKQEFPPLLLNLLTLTIIGIGKELFLKKNKMLVNLRNPFLSILDEFEYISGLSDSLLSKDFFIHKIFHSPFEFKTQENQADYENTIFLVYKDRNLLEFKVEKLDIASKSWN